MWKLQLLAITTFIAIELVYSKVRHEKITYFRRLNEDGSFVDRGNVEEFELIFRFERYEEKDEADSSAFVKITPSLVDNGDRITVSWNGVENATDKDWVGFFCPHDSNIKLVLDYFYPSIISSTWKNGTGQYQVHVYNMRSDCEFRYYHVVESTTTLLAHSNLLSFNGGPAYPLQGHLALTSETDQMRVMWVSGTDETATVKFGKHKDNLSEVTMGTTKTYKASDHCGPPANTTGFRDPGFIHDTVLKSLESNTLYYYSFGSSKGMSPVKNFTSAIRPGDKSPFMFVAYGDMGTNPYPQSWGTEKNMIKEYRDNDMRMIFHVGDIAYAFGEAYVWEEWHAIIEPYATLVPYMVGVGNHEQDHTSGGEKDPSKAVGTGFHPSWGNYGDDSGGECGVPMFNRFHMPDNGNFLWWYSYNFGMVHYIMISTEHDFSPGSRQYQWLESDLKSVDRSKTPWVILGGHRPMYESENVAGDYLVGRNMQRLLEDLLFYNNVDIAFWGHYHSYERTCKIYRDECEKNGIVHVTVGTAGFGLDSATWNTRRWSVKRFSEYGYSRVSVLNSTALHTQFIRNKDSAVLDDFYVFKE